MHRLTVMPPTIWKRCGNFSFMHHALLTMYTDSQGLSPFEYFDSAQNDLDRSNDRFRLEKQQVNALLVQERVIDRVFRELFLPRQHSFSDMTAMEKIDFIVDPEGFNASIMEAGFSV
ncbi:hypothetical protein IV203_016563 [Nitzschia inconspicua]|uniref:Uncharacterized protein n=1 Tax=Nitzschia inconspicua TaxID=303405 RepID=A0A9K3KPZ2_9STRA|nr:hypothetical protein IV203_016563 [Nitzschia inconspicua]